jgi:hypothetical protein
LKHLFAADVMNSFGNNQDRKSVYILTIVDCSREWEQARRVLASTVFNIAGQAPEVYDGVWWSTGFLD